MAAYDYASGFLHAMAHPANKLQYRPYRIVVIHDDCAGLPYKNYYPVHALLFRTDLTVITFKLCLN